MHIDGKRSSVFQNKTNLEILLSNWLYRLIYEKVVDEKAVEPERRDCRQKSFTLLPAPPPRPRSPGQKADPSSAKAEFAGVQRRLRDQRRVGDSWVPCGPLHGSMAGTISFEERRRRRAVQQTASGWGEAQQARQKSRELCAAVPLRFNGARSLRTCRSCKTRGRKSPQQRQRRRRVRM